MYIFHHKRYCQLARQGDTFGFVGLSAADAGAVSTAAVLGGWAGAALASASTSGRPTDYTLSLLTGRVSTLAEDDYVTTPDTVHLHIYCRKSSLGPKPEPVYLNEQLIGELFDNQALGIDYTEHVGEVHLRLGSRKDRELVFQPGFLAPMYMKMVRSPDGETRPPLERVSAKVGTFDLRRIKPRTTNE